MWLFKVAEEDFYLCSCDQTPKLFHLRSSDSVISEKTEKTESILSYFLSRQKAFCVISGGLRPLVAEMICQSIHKKPKNLHFCIYTI